MKSYVKVYGPPLREALRALEQVAHASTKTLIGYSSALTPAPTHTPFGQMEGRREADYDQQLDAYLASVPVAMEVEAKAQLLSTSGHTLGEYDFFFEWGRDPTWKEVEDLMGKIDAALTPLGCRYTLTTK